jgi:hypothetical protein
MYEVFAAKLQERWDTPIADGKHKSASRGLVGRQIAAIEHPWLPISASCTLLFWQVRIDM